MSADIVDLAAIRTARDKAGQRHAEPIPEPIPRCAWCGRERDEIAVCPDCSGG